MSDTDAIELAGILPRLGETPRVPAQPLPADVAAALSRRHVQQSRTGPAGSGITVLAGFSRSGARFAPIDHVVVGPGGVFVVVAAQADVELRDGTLCRGGRDCAGLLGEVVDAAAAVAELLPRIDPAHVRAVLALADGPGSETVVGDVLVCPATEVVGVVRGSSAVMDAAEAAFVGRRLAVQQQPPAAAPGPRARRGLRGLLGRR